MKCTYANRNEFYLIRRGFSPMEMKHQSILKGLHLKQTPKRLALLDILGSQATYLSPPEIWLRMKQRFKRIGLPTVYRNLEKLSENGIITRVLHPNRQLYYYYCDKGGHHHHFVCFSCGRIEDLDYCWGETLREDVERRLKGKMIGHLLQADGMCKECLKSRRKQKVDKDQKVRRIRTHGYQSRGK